MNTKSPEARRSESRLRPITLREIGVVIGLVALGLRTLPRPLDLITATALPPVYFLTRSYPRARFCRSFLTLDLPEERSCWR
jgi:hypothetical protein